MAAIVKNKILRTVGGNPNVIESLHTVTAGKKAAANFSLFNPSSIAQDVFIGIRGLAGVTDDVVVTGAVTETGRVAARRDIARISGSGNNSFAITSDYRQVSHDGGLTWSLLDPTVFFAYAFNGTYYVRFTVFSADVIHIHAMNISNGTYVSQANAFVLSETGIGTRMLANPKYFTERVLVDATANFTGFFPNASGLVSRYYGSGLFSSVAAGKTITLADDDVANIPAASAVITFNNSSGYSGVLDLAAADYNYNYYTTPGDTVPDKLVGSNAILSGGTTAQKVHPCSNYVLVLTANNKFMWITRIPSTNSQPTYGALNNMPINTSDVVAVVDHAAATKAIIFTANGLVYEAGYAGSTMPQVTTAIPYVDTVNGVHFDGAESQYFQSQNSYAAYFGTAYGSTTYWNNSASLGLSPGVLVEGTVYKYLSLLENILMTERYTIPAGSSIDVSGRIYPSEAEIVLIARGGVGTRIHATLNMLES